MSSVVVFDSTGRCKYVLDGDPSTVDLSNESAVVVSETPVDPNSVWYDFSKQSMLYKKPFACLVSLNKISNLPPGTLVIANYDSVLVEDGEIEFDVTYNQTLYVTLINVGRITQVLEVPCEVQG